MKNTEPVDSFIGIDDGEGQCMSSFLGCPGKGEKCSDLNPLICGSICQMSTTNNYLSSQTTHNYLQEDFFSTFSFIYQLRDEIKTGKKGGELIINYYKIGKLHIEKDISMSLDSRVDIAVFTIQNIGIVSNFLENPSSSNNFISNTQYDSIKDIIAEVRNDSDDPDYEALIDYFRYELDNIKDKSISEVWDYLKL